MRLLKRSSTGDIELVSVNDDDPPPYAILSHTWIEGQEVTYDELVARSGKDKAGQNKIHFCMERAAEAGLQYCWVDTCCINRSTSDELSTAINSMFRWYQRAGKCYVYLSDVQIPDEVTDPQAFRITWAEAFRRSRWFTRGWTLQELLAPATVEFFSREGKRLGSKISLEQDISELTKIPIQALRGTSLSEFSVDERLSWAVNRKTTLKEDKVYCLLGIFGVFLSLIYGEGEVNATLRLREEIQRRQAGWNVEVLQNLTIFSPLGSAVSKTVPDGQGSRNALLLMSQLDGSFSHSEPSVWALANVAGSSSKRTYYEVPIERKTARFVGQSSVLLEIDNHFKSLFLEDNPAPCIITLVGMGGIGKTQLALEYCKLAHSRKHNTFPDVFWFNASSEDALMTDFMKFSTMLAPSDRQFDALTERVEFVLSVMNSWKGRLLIVFDNFDDPSFINVLDYLPRLGACGILFTSRLREAGDEFGNMIDVPLMSGNDANQLLLSRLRLTDIAEGEALDCQRVIDLLGNLPLALEQAGAYMTRGGARMSFRGFVHEFETKKQIIMNTTPRFWKYTNISDAKVKSASLSVLTTWNLSLDRLGESAEDRTKKTHFLTVLCFLDCNRISMAFFRSYSKIAHEIPVYSRNTDWMSLFKSAGQLFDEDKFQSVVVELANLSLIRQSTAEILDNNLVVTVHPLIRDWAQFRQNAREQEAFAIEVSCIVAALLHDHEDPAQAISFESLIPTSHRTDDWQYAVLLRDMMAEILAHMDACVKHWKALHITSQGTISDYIFVTESLFARMYIAARQSDKGYEMFERMHSTAVMSLGRDHESSLNLSIELCSVRVLEGRGSEVQDKLEHLVEHHATLKSEDIHFNNYTLARFWLLHLYTAQGDVMKATKLAKSLLTSFLLMDFDDNLDLKFICASHFADLLGNLGLQEDSQMLRQSLITRYKRKINFRSQNNSTRSRERLAMLEMNFARQLLSLHEKDETVEILEKAESLLRGIEAYIGGDANPMVKFSLKFLHGSAFAARGLWLEAIQQTELGYRYSVEAYGHLHPVTTDRRNVLVKQVLRSPDKDTVHATRIVTEALNAAAEQLGPSHDKVLALQRQSATVIFNERHRRTALPFYDDLVRKLAEHLTPDDLKLLRAQSELAYCLYLIPDRSELETQQCLLLHRTLIKFEHLYSKSEATTKSVVQIRERLGFLLREVKQYPEARQCYEQALAKQMSLTTRSDVDTWTIQQSIAACYRFQREPLSALKTLRDVEEAQMNSLDGTHEGVAFNTYVSTVHQMGMCYAALDFDEDPTAYTSGRDCYERVLKMYLTKSHGKLSAQVATTHRLLGDLHHKKGKHMEAIESYELALQFSRQERGSTDHFADLVYLGDELRLAEAWDKQKLVALERLAWTREFRGLDSEETMWTIGVLASNAEHLKELDSSLKYRKEELRLRQKIFDGNPGKIFDCMAALSNVYYLLGEFESARSTTMEVLQLRSTLSDYDRKDDIRYLADLATIEVDLLDWEASMLHSRQIIEFYQHDSLDLAPHLITAEIMMGLALYRQARFTEAEVYITRSVGKRGKLFGGENIATMKSRFWLAKIMFKQEKYQEAADLLNHCMPSLRSMDHVSPYWKGFWEDQISTAGVELELCRSKMDTG